MLSRMRVMLSEVDGVRLGRVLRLRLGGVEINEVEVKWR